MKKTGAYLAVYALEQIGVKHTFGIPGVHTTELYDELNNSSIIEPILVTHEGGASFMADGVSRTSDSIGVCAIVPAAGTTHAMSGMGEAFLDGIPMLVISGGTRNDSGKHYQLHQLDLEKLVQGVTKKFFKISAYKDIIPTIYQAYDIATSGEPGPVYIELPIEFQLFAGEVDQLPLYRPKRVENFPQNAEIKAAVDLLIGAKNPGMYVGWGAMDCVEELAYIAETLVSPVSTTLQGLSAFPGNHSMHTGVGFGPSAVPACQKAFKHCDVMLAIGVRFSELGTGSYGARVPEKLIHIDINPNVFDKNYKSKIKIEGDAKQVLKALVNELKSRNFSSARSADEEAKTIQQNKQTYWAEWEKGLQKDKVSPGYFFSELRKQIDPEGIMVVDDGKHTFLSAELFPVYRNRGFISPTDFNCMGYCVPAAIGTKLMNTDKQVVAIVGDGAFLMTCMELLTASTLQLGVMVFVFHDGELGQISQFQKIPLNRKVCTILPEVNFKGVAMATGAHFIAMDNDMQIQPCIEEALKVSSTGKPVVVDVKIDYSKKTFLTKGVVKTNLSRFPTAEKIRFISRAIKRHTLG